MRGSQVAAAATLALLVLPAFAAEERRDDASLARRAIAASSRLAAAREALRAAPRDPRDLAGLEARAKALLAARDAADDLVAAVDDLEPLLGDLERGAAGARDLEVRAARGVRWRELALLAASEREAWGMEVLLVEARARGLREPAERREEVAADLARERPALEGRWRTAIRAFETARAEAASVTTGTALLPSLRGAGTEGPVDGAPPRVVAAYQALTAGELTLAARTSELELLEAHRARWLALARAAQEVIGIAGPLDDLLVRAAVATGEPQPRDEVARVRRDARGAIVRTARELAGLERALAVARRAAAAIDVAALESVYRASIEDARFTGELQVRSLAEVEAQFRATWPGWQRAEDALAAARKEAREATSATDAERARLQQSEDPLIRRARSEHEDERRTIVEALSKRAGLDLPPAKDVTDRKPSPQAPRPFNTATLIEAGEKLDATLSGRIRSLDERLARSRDLVAALERERAALDALGGAIERAREAGRAAAGPALELRARRSPLAPQALPGPELGEPLTIEERAAHERRSTIEERLAAIPQLRADAEKKRQLLAQELAVIGRKLDALRSRAALETAYDQAPSSDIEKKRKEQEVAKRLEDEESWLEAALGLFRSERADEETKLLGSWYSELEELERRARNVEQRHATSQRLVAIARELKTVLAKALPIAREELANLRVTAAERDVAAGLRSPEEAALDLAGRAPPPARPPRTSDEVQRTADALFDARARAIAWETWVRDLETALSRVGLDAEIGAHEDDLNALAARTNELGRDSQRIESEIAAGRARRRDILGRSALWSISSLVAIPLVAWFFLRLLHRYGGRLIRFARPLSPGADDKEREQRARTLGHVLGKAVNVLVYSVAAIYMLKQLRIDVTPILASAGVAGLALAFGAQTLVKDWLSGFFMLLEGQFGIGDVIRTGDAAGTVERITLRLTVLRDTDGTIHFVPNGSIARVSNSSSAWSSAELRLLVPATEDLDRVMKLVDALGADLLADRGLGPKLAGSPSIVSVEPEKDGASVIRVAVRTRPGASWDVPREVRRRFDRELAKAGAKVAVSEKVEFRFRPAA